MSKLKYNILLILIFTGKILFSQVNDAGLWLSLNIEKKINPDLSICLSEEFRLNENFSELGSIFSDVGLNYNLNKHIKLSVNYRFTNKRKLDDSYDKRHRYYFDLSFKKKKKPINLSFRSRYQSQYTNIYSSADGLTPKNYLREKLTIKLDLDKNYEPYIYSEGFFSLNNPTGNGFDNIRYCSGIEYSFNRACKLDLFYLIQKEYNVKNPKTDYIIGLGYSFSF